MRVVLRAIGGRVVAYGGALLLVFLFFGDVHWGLTPGWLARRAESRPQPAETAESGWPHLRGPTYDGISDETDLVDYWPPEGPPVLWMLELGRGYSGFSAAAGRVYTQTQTLSTQAVLCLDGDTGRQIWEHRYGWAYQAAGMYPGPRATPTWHDGRIYFAGPRGLVGCLRADDGTPLWSVNVKKKFKGRGTGFGYACSPLVEDGKVILPVGGKGASVVALDVRDGSVVWASGDEPSSYSSAVPITFGGRRHVVTLLQNVLASFDLETGRLLWEEKLSGGYDEHSTFPLYREPYLMIANPFRSGAELFRIEAGDGEAVDGGPTKVSAIRLWHRRHMSNDVASSILVDGAVFGFDLREPQVRAHRPSRGQFRCMDFNTGDVLWSSDEPGHAAGIFADGKLILFNDSGELILMRADPRRYVQLARTRVFEGEICWTAPALYRGRLYLRTPSRAACLYIGKPDRLSRRRLESARPIAEIPKSRPLDPGWVVGSEREYPADPPDLQELCRWFVFCVAGVFGVAASIALLVHVVVWMKWPKAARPWGHVVFWSGAFVLGAVGTPVCNRFWPEFVFTWPVALFVAHQAALTATIHSRQGARSEKSPWLSIAAGLMLLTVCLSYFNLCRVLNLAVNWVFLMGFLPAWPVAIPAARRPLREGRLLWDLIWAVLAFSVYFWASGGFALWRAMSG